MINERKKILIELMNDKNYVPMKFKELAVVLNVAKKDRKALDEALNELIDEGQIVLSKKGKYSVPRDEYVKGTFIGNERGFGFIEVEGLEEDFFVPKSDTNGAFHQDKVLAIVSPSSKGRRKEARVIKVIEHTIEEVVGFFEANNNFAYVLPDNKKINRDIYVPSRYFNGAKNRQKVIVQIVDYGDKSTKPEGKVVEVLGNIDDPGVDVMSMISSYAIPNEFPEEVLAEARKIPSEVEADLSNRRDLRDQLTVTIDGDDAKDLDDAITLHKEGDNYVLGVHIADVAEYVKEGTALDDEAVNRATSVYLVDRVIPMLPQELSNGICSLNMGVDRLALSCIMTIDPKGNIITYDICESVINVDKRMSYNEVYKALKGDASSDYKPYQNLINLMYETSHILRKRRNNRGAINFDTRECHIVLDENGKVKDIKPAERNRANKIIEDFMLAANETVAEHFYWREVPFVYRNHEEPDAKKMSELALLVSGLGYNLKSSGGNVHPMEIQKLMSAIEDTPEESFITNIALRSMQRAVYQPNNAGHFGLSAKFYCHFTSPIRRYPDLMIHRIIKKCINDKMTPQESRRISAMLDDLTEHCSFNERRAAMIERDVDDMKKAEYMKKHIGDIYSGIISGVTDYGFYVELDNTVEGLVHVSTIQDDHYTYSEEEMLLRGEGSKQTYRIGDKVTVMCVSANKLAGNIDFEVMFKND